MHKLISIVVGVALGLAACGGDGGGEGIDFGDIPSGQDTVQDQGGGGDITTDGGPTDVEADGDAVVPDVAPDGIEDVDPDGIEDVEPDGVEDVDPDGIEDVEPDGVGDVEPDTAEDVETDAGPTCPTPPEDPCETEGERRCVLDSDVVEECALDQDGCLAWTAVETCLTTNLCTGEADECVAGECVPTAAPIVDCVPTDQQCLENACNPETGECELMEADDFEPCDDGNVCTEGDQCFQGTCQGSQACPVECGGPNNTLLGSLSCGDVVDLTLNDGGTDVMDAYGCEGAMDGSTGWERTFRIQNKNAFDCPDMELTVELPDPALQASDYVDVVVLDKAMGICWPDDCLGVGFMDDDGRGALSMNLPQGADWLVVVDGRNGYIGDARVAVNCCGSNVEAFCGNGVDDDGDGTPVDCNDSDCVGSTVCDFEHVCDNGEDDDGDGLEDCLDPECADLPACQIETDCGNGIDDDEDGSTDCDDVADCGHEPACGGGCPDAVLVACGETLPDQTLGADGTSTFAGEAIPCGDDQGVTIEAPHGLYAASIPAGCSGQFVLEGSGFFADLMVAGPACELSGCVDSQFAFGEAVSLPLQGVSPAYLIVSSGAGQTDVPYSVGLECACQ